MLDAGATPSYQRRIMGGWRQRTAAVVLALLATAGAAGAQSFEVPDGFMREMVRETDAEGRHVTVLRVVPEPGPFSELSSIEMRPLPDDIEAPVEWLEGRMTAFLGDSESADVETALNAPDSPFADPAFAPLTESLQALMDQLRRLGEVPLQFCDAPRRGDNAAGSYDELACRFAIGPLGRHLVLRLQQVDGVWYYTRISTMNERRLRHMLAIANSFQVK